MNSNEIPAQELVEVLTMQRNVALDQAAAAMARSVAFQKENEALRKELEALKQSKE